MRGLPPLPGTAGLTLESVFDGEGALARALPDYEPRPGQRRLAAAVADVFETGGLLLAEAGTGTGKTLAYLVPAILSRQRVLVSTGTKNLQEQIFTKDLPILAEALPIPFKATYMKGRANYLCLHRFESARAGSESRSPAERAVFAVLDDWAANTDTGDRAEVGALPDPLPLWSEIAASQENCIGTQCPRFDDCFVTRMRQRAAEADLVIVNHHLLCADASIRDSSYGEVIPECAFTVIDEAHQLEDVATQYFGTAVSTYRFDALVRDGERLAAGPDLDEDASGGLREALERIRARSRAFFSSLALATRADRAPGAGDDRVRLTEGMLAAVGEASSSLGAALDALEATARLIKDVSEDLVALARRASALAGDLRFLLDASDSKFVYFVEVRARGVFLRAAPIDVSTLVRETILDRFRAVVLTSATLTIEDSFDYARARLGAADAQALQLPSEFDYARQALLYLPPSMPDPRSPRFIEAATGEIVEILRRTCGRAFVLFTSYAAMRQVHAALAGALPFPLLVQGDAPRTALLHEFRTTPHAVLFATSSFWQGVDVAGDALSCVIVDRLPFASPGDPITAARIDAVAASGRSAFQDFQVPAAVLALQQGLGRLIRHRTDRGVMAILDPRVRTMAYGQKFLRSLPPARLTMTLEDVERFFA